MKKLKYFFITIIFFQISCTNSSDKSNQAGNIPAGYDSISITNIDTNQNKGNENNIKKVDSSKQIVCEVHTNHNIPLPLTFYQKLETIDKNYYTDILVDLKKAKKVNKKINKAFVLGMITSDLAYSIVYKNSQSSLYYIETAKEISDKLKIGAGYDEQTIKQINDNIDNIDSLQSLTNNAYRKSIHYLELQNNIHLLPFIIVGGWTESLYIAVSYPEPNTNLIQLIIEQKQVITELINYMHVIMTESNTYRINMDIQDIIEHLKKLKKTMNSYNTEKASELSKGQNQILKNQIEEIRNLYLQN